MPKKILKWGFCAFKVVKMRIVGVCFVSSIGDWSKYQDWGIGSSPVAQVGEMPILSQNSRGVHYGNEKTK